MSGSHYKQVCEQCGDIVAQCRCMSCDKAVVVKGLCAKCATQPQDKGSAGQQSAIAVQQANTAICPKCGSDDIVEYIKPPVLFVCNACRASWGKQQ